MMRRWRALGIVMCMLACVPLEACTLPNHSGEDTSATTQNEISQEERAQLKREYKTIRKRIKKENLPISMTVDGFIEEYAYAKDSYGTVDEYVSRFNKLLDDAVKSAEENESEDEVSDEDAVEGEGSSN